MILQFCISYLKRFYNFFYQTLKTKPYAAPWTVVSFSRKSALIHIYYITTVFDNIWIIQCAKSSSTLLSWMEHLRHWIQRYERKIQSWKLAHLPFLSFWSFDASHSLAVPVVIEMTPDNQALQLFKIPPLPIVYKFNHLFCDLWKIR